MDRLPSVNIVVISYGHLWLLTNYPGREKDPANATVDIFKSRIVPFIESKHNPAKPYVVMGHSMGGFNAATLCAAQPDMWSKCVLVNPLLPSWDPFQKTLLDEFHVENPFSFLNCLADLQQLLRCLGRELIKANFSEEDWRTTKPMVLLNKTTGLRKAFVTACKGDVLVDFDGSKQWAELAKSKNADSTWEPGMAGCNHFHWPYQRVLHFLAN